MKESDVITLLKKAVNGGTQKQVAARIGCSQQFLGDVLRGMRPPTGAVLAYLGIEKKCDYRKVKP